MLKRPTVLLIGAALLLVPAASQDRGDRPLPVLASEHFESGRADGWEPNDPARWSVLPVGRNLVYALTAPGEQGKVRAPTSWSLWSAYEVGSFELAGRLQCAADTANPKRDMCVLFGFQGPTHFAYVHFSASSDDAHNIIAVVNGADRVRVSVEAPGTSAARLTDKEWHAFKVTFNAATGEIRAYLDDMKAPILTARDLTFVRGRVGVGSFDDTGSFDDLTLRGVRVTLGGTQRVPLQRAPGSPAAVPPFSGGSWPPPCDQGGIPPWNSRQAVHRNETTCMTPLVR